MNWYKIAQQIQEEPQLISLQDLINLYRWELPYGEYYNKKRLGEELSDRENMEFLWAQHYLTSIVEKLGKQFYEICEKVAISSMPEALDSCGTYVCPKCFYPKMLIIDHATPIHFYPNSKLKNDLDFDMCQRYLVCPECGFYMCRVDWDDYAKDIVRDHGSDWFYTEYGIEYAVDYINMWKDAKTLNEKIIALQYIINAVHGSGPMIGVFVAGDMNVVIRMLDKLSNGIVGEYYKPNWYFKGQY